MASNCPPLPRGHWLFESLGSLALPLRPVAQVWHQSRPLLPRGLQLYEAFSVRLCGSSTPCGGSSLAPNCPLLPRGLQLYQAFSSLALQLHAVAQVWHQTVLYFLVVPQLQLRGFQLLGFSTPYSSSTLASQCPLLPRAPQLFATFSSLALQLLSLSARCLPRRALLLPALFLAGCWTLWLLGVRRAANLIRTSAAP